MTAYAPVYASTDLSTLIIDGIGTGFAAVIGFASLVALTILFVWLKKNM